MLIGYARVSTEEQHLYMQEDELKRVGCEEIYTDVASGVKTARPGLDEALSHFIICSYRMSLFRCSLLLNELLYSTPHSNGKFKSNALIQKRLKM